ncbi:Sigma-54 dependent, Vanadium nitrogenase transcriptional regulator, VnfA [Plesiocystis pacifica SIR-1]|uniref:Sigma-54 dependent, Vanadium nitrogenase transcriptional regulator, VnfA n=1 Tax=Plesiocystis pacifica SIR-1 TaxID=391625 RepID=A6GJF4_9BACT|nr:sigma-54-dependent Fis family transcriptional regulator [Plesiocystis pacifica]EDM73994.1 Sigma-54 dependent, Vanadium nitrogenase transcriptional regulator, VnfA [Plesiocystis pacifica SIR-1]
MMADPSLLRSPTQALNEGMELRSVVNSILRMLAERPAMVHPYLTLVEPESGESHLEEAPDMTPEQQRRIRPRHGEGIVGRVVQSGRTRVVHGSSDSFLNRLGRSEPEGMSFICAPLRQRDGEIVGTLAVDHRGQDPAALQGDVLLIEALAEMLGRAIELRRRSMAEREAVELENQRLRAELRGRFRVANIIGNHKSMAQVYDRIARVSSADTTVLLRGESGTGKELVARAIHFASPRAEAPFVAVNCAALPEGTLESELFGHERGAFTGAIGARKGRFELADGGTLFLDEIGELRPHTQVKLLRVLQERRFERVGGATTRRCDVRVLTATHADLEAAMARGEFREDLYYRLNVFEIMLPPLRERGEDILALADFFVERYGPRQRPPVTRIGHDAARHLLAWDWPGNVRELENCIERAVLLTNDGVIEAEHLPPTLRGAAGPSRARASNTPASRAVAEGRTLDEALEAVEREILERALADSGGNRASAARALGISERRMGLRVKKYRL